MNQPKKEASRIVFTQVGVVLILGLLGCGLIQVHWGLSFMIGGLIAWLPNLLLYRLLFRYFGAQKFIKAFYLGQFLKFLLTLTGFIAVFVWTSWQPLPVFFGFISVQSVFWFALLPTRKLKVF